MFRRTASQLVHGWLGQASAYRHSEPVTKSAGTTLTSHLSTAASGAAAAVAVPAVAVSIGIAVDTMFHAPSEGTCMRKCGIVIL